MEGAGYGQPPQTQQHSGPATSSTSRSAGEEVASSSQQQAGSVAHTAAAPAAATAVQLTPEQLAAIQYQQYFAQLQAVQQQQQQQQQSEATGQPVAAWPSGAASEGVGQSQQPLYVVSSSAAGDWQRSVGLWSQLPHGVAQYQFAPSLAPVAVSGAPSSSGQQQLLHAPVLAPPAFPPGLAGKMPEGVYTTAPSGLMGSSGLDSSGLGKVGGGVGKRSAKRPRLVWTHELHSRFINAVNHLGVKNAVPITILQLMNVEGMTRENVASHLQKYRLHLKRLAGVAPNATIPPEMLPQVQAQAHAQHQQQLQQVALNPQGRAALVSHPGGQLLQTSAPQSTQVAAPAQQTQLMPEQQQQQHQGMLAAQGLQFVGIPQAGGAPPMMLHPGGAPAMQQWQGMPLAITSLQGAAAVAAGAGGQQAPPPPVATGETQQQQQTPHAQGLFYVPGGEQAAYHQAAAYQQYPVTLLGYSQAPGGGEQAAQPQQQQLLGSRAPGPMSLLPAGYQAMMQPGSWLPQASPAFPMPPLPMAEATATPVHSQPPAQTTTQQS